MEEEVWDPEHQNQQEDLVVALVKAVLVDPAVEVLLVEALREEPGTSQGLPPEPVVQQPMRDLRLQTYLSLQLSVLVPE